MNPRCDNGQVRKGTHTDRERGRERHLHTSSTVSSGLQFACLQIIRAYTQTDKYTCMYVCTYVCTYMHSCVCVCIYIRTDLRFVIVFCAFFCIYMLPILVIYVPATLRVRARESESIARSHVAVIGKILLFSSLHHDKIRSHT